MSGGRLVSSWRFHRLPGVRKLAMSVVVAAVGHAAGVAAQATDSELAVARQLFHESFALESRGRWTEAAEKLRKAIAIKDTPGLRYHLAYCLEGQNLLVEADAQYVRAGEMIDAGIAAPDVAELLDAARERVAKATPTLQVDVEPHHADATLRVGGDERPGIGRAIPLDPGSHELRVEARGYATWSRQLDVARGDRRRFTVRLTPVAPLPEPVEPAALHDERIDDGAPKDWSEVTVAAIAGGGVVVGALAFGISSAVLSASAGARAEPALREVQMSPEWMAAPVDSRERLTTCNGPPPTIQAACDDLAAARGDQVLFRHAAIGGFIVAGIAAAGTAVALWQFWPDDTTEDVSVSAAFDEHGGSAAVALRF